jgi:hypothetical protein
MPTEFNGIRRSNQTLLLFYFHIDCQRLKIAHLSLCHMALTTERSEEKSICFFKKCIAPAGAKNTAMLPAG